MSEKFVPAPSLEGLRAGDETQRRRSFNDFIEPRRQDLVKLAGRRLHGTRAKQQAEDVVQDALLGVWRNIPTMRRDENFEGYLATAIFNRAASHGTRATREQNRVELREPSELPVPKDNDKDIGNNVAENDSYEGLVNLLQDKISETYLSALLLHVEGYEYTEIAEKLNIPLGTVQSRIHRGKRQANKLLREMGQDQGYAKREDERVKAGK